MQLIKTVKEIQAISDKLRAEGKKIGFVPTMGYLHEGHASLVVRAKELADIAIVSIFVNPTQFGPTEDYAKYPRDLNKDLLACEAAGADYVFAPEDKEMYPGGFNTEVSIKGVSDKFEGSFRPIHFNGVATVVTKLFLAVKPHIAVFGQKDYQQTLVVKQAVRDMLMDVAIEVAPTVREADGLAKSSRNTYLSAEERILAITLYKALNSARQIISSGAKNRQAINDAMSEVINNSGAFKIDYASSALFDDLSEPEEFKSGQEIVCLIAAYLGKTRLIDNCLITIP
jgi:pantoate--beta-alanine ligase